MEGATQFDYPYNYPYNHPHKCPHKFVCKCLESKQ